MGEWIGELKLSRRPGRSGEYRLEAPLRYVTGDGWRIEVLPGWYTDGASIPRLLRWYADPFGGPYAAAAVLHDALYRSQLLTRVESDQVFRAAMIDAGVRRAQAWVLWAGVRIGGWMAWSAKEPDQVWLFQRMYVRLQAAACEAEA